MAQRILIAELKQETATFNPAPTRYDDFRIYRGADIIDAYGRTDRPLHVGPARAVSGPTHAARPRHRTGTR